MPEEKKRKRKKANPDQSASVGIASFNGGSSEWVEMNAIDDDDGGRKCKGAYDNVLA